jgi:hypothetical protein
MEHSEHWYDYTRNDPNRENPFEKKKPQFAGNYPGPLYAPHPDIKKMTHEEMLEEAARREQEVQNNMKRAVEIDKVIEEAIEKYKPALQELAKEEWERKERSDTVLARYNRFYNDECSGMPHGTPITPEHQQAMALECMIDALICENMNVEYDVIAIDDIKDLIEGLYRQSNEYLKRVQEFKDSADGVA